MVVPPPLLVARLVPPSQTTAPISSLVYSTNGLFVEPTELKRKVSRNWRDPYGGRSSAMSGL